GPINPGHGLLGPDLPPGSVVAVAGVPRRAPVLWAALVARGMPAGPGAGLPSAPASWPVALPPVESVAPGGRRSVRSRLAAAPAVAIPGGPDVGRLEGGRRR